MLHAGKQYTYVTMKLLLFLQSAYLVSLVIVLLHWELFSNNVYSVSNLTECINKLMDRVVNEGVGIAPCAIEAFINLSFYNVPTLT